MLKHNVMTQLQCNYWKTFSKFIEYIRDVIFLFAWIFFNSFHFILFSFQLNVLHLKTVYCIEAGDFRPYSAKLFLVRLLKLMYCICIVGSVPSVVEFCWFDVWEIWSVIAILSKLKSDHRLGWEYGIIHTFSFSRRYIQ